MFEGGIKKNKPCFEEAVKQSISKHTWISSQVIEKGKLSLGSIQVLRVNKIKTVTNYSVDCCGTDLL